MFFHIYDGEQQIQATLFEIYVKWHIILAGHNIQRIVTCY